MTAFLAFCDDEANLAMGDPVAFRAYLRKFVGRDVAVSVRRWQDKRSLDQNAYWWAVPVSMLAGHLGCDRTDLHYSLLGQCFGYHIGPMGHAIANRPSSSKLKTGEFSTLIEWVGPWAWHQYQVAIPEPGTPTADQMVGEFEGTDD